jgi:hypothetical protein
VIKKTAQSIDRVAFNDIFERKKRQLNNYGNSPEFTFLNRSRILSCGDEPIFRPVTLQLLQEATYEMASDLYAKAFKEDPTAFSYVFVGDICERSLFKSLLGKYLGRLRSNHLLADKVDGWISNKNCNNNIINANSNLNHEQSTKYLTLLPDNNDVFSVYYPFTLTSSNFEINGPINESMYLLKEEKATMMMIFRADMRLFLNDDDDVKFSISLEAAFRVLQTYLLDELRIKLGKVYNVCVEKSRNSLSTFFYRTTLSTFGPRSCQNCYRKCFYFAKNCRS